MSLRKLVSVILAFAFVSTSFVPAFAAVLLDNNEVTTLPVVAPDVGTTAIGANRDVVPVNLRINAQGTDALFTTLTSLASGLASLTVSANGQLASSGNGTLTGRRALVFTPPTGTKFVQLAGSGYVDVATTATTVNGETGSAVGTLVNLSGSAPAAAFPDSGTNGHAIIAAVLTKDGPASTFGATTVPAGSVVIYFVSGDPTNAGGAAGLQLSLTGIGLAADPAASPTTTGSATATVASLTGGNVLSAMSSAAGSTIHLASYGSHAGKVEFMMVGDNTGTETSATVEPDAQTNNVLGNLLASGSSTVTIGPGNITSTTSGVTTLKVDTDALVLRAAERNDSTVNALKFFATPFATSAFVTTNPVTDLGTTNAAVLNTAITATSATFPNATNAAMTVRYYAYKPGTTTPSSATLTVNATSVTLVGPKAFNGIRGKLATVGGNNGGIAQSLSSNGGFLGAVVNTPFNGASAISSVKTKLGIGVIYNGTAATRIVMKDVATLDSSRQNTKVGTAINGGTLNKSFIAAATSPTTINNGTWAKGIFPGSLVASVINGNVATPAIVNKATSNGTTADYFTFTAASPTTVMKTTDALYAPGEVTARLVPAAANAWFFIAGNSTGGDDTGAGSYEIGASNPSNDIYSNGATAKKAAGAQTTRNARNNAIAVANLLGTTLTILPITNKHDGFRSAIVVRPEITLTLDTTSKAEGVDIVAVATGGNLPATGTTKVVAKILAAGTVTTNTNVQVLPVAGDFSGLMVESATAAGTSRAAVALSGVTGASTSADTVSDLATTGLAIDTTVPPLFCGGTAGTGTKGPNGTVFQPKARAVLISENGALAFDDIIALGSNTVVRVTLPTGWDLNAYNGSLAGSEILTLINTATISSPSITRVQPLSTNGNVALANAFVDISLGSVSAPTVSTMRRAIGLIFRPNALVVPASVSDFTATISLVNTGGSETRDGSVADDVVLSTMGTVELADACSTFLTVGYCTDGIDSYQASGGGSTITSERVANGANLISFGSTPGPSARLIAISNVGITLPDLCIAEGVADALPIGIAADGVPNAFGVVSTTSIGTGTLHIASSFNGSTATGSVGLNGGSAIYTSDRSMTVGAVTSAGLNERSIALSDNGSTVGPFEVATTLRIKGLTMRAGSGTTPPPAQSFYAWFEATGTNATYTVGSNVPQAFNYNAVNGTALSNVAGSAATENGKMLAAYANGGKLDGTSLAATAANYSDSSVIANSNALTILNSFGNPATLTNAVSNTFDGASYTKLDQDLGETFTVSLSNITGSTDKLVEVSAQAGSLEAGSVLSVSSTGSGPQDTMLVPVLADGSFKALVRASTSQQITLIQTPTSVAATLPQVASLNVADANVDPKLLSATADVLSGLGSIPNKGKVAVVFTVTTSGKLSGSDFVPTAAQLTLGGAPVTAVTGSTTQFIGIADLNKAGGLTLASTVTDNTVELSVTTVAASGAKPRLTAVVENAAGFIFAKGTNLRSGEVFGFVLSNGTFSPVTLRARTKSDKEKNRRRSAAAATIPATAVYAIFVSPGKGVSSVAVN